MLLLQGNELVTIYSTKDLYFKRKEETAWIIKRKL